MKGRSPRVAGRSKVPGPQADVQRALPNAKSGGGSRCSLAASRFGLGTGCELRFFGAVLALLVSGLALQGATNDPDAIPPLAPPRGELAPTFWEEHGMVVLIAGAVLVVLVGVVIWLLTRPKPLPPLSSEAQARQALEPLRQRPEDGVLLSQVSQIMRHYCAAAFGLPAGEMTTAEFCRALTESPRPGPEFARAVGEFLRSCDERKFAPPAVAGGGSGSGRPAGSACVAQALAFVEQAESRLRELSAAQAAHSAPASKGV